VKTCRAMNERKKRRPTAARNANEMRNGSVAALRGLKTIYYYFYDPFKTRSVCDRDIDPENATVTAEKPKLRN